MCKNGQKRRAVWGWLEFEWAHGHLSHRTRLQLMSIWLKYNKLLHYTMLSFLYKQTPLRGTRELASSLLCLSVCMSLSLSLCVFVRVGGGLSLCSADGSYTTGCHMAAFIPGWVGAGGGCRIKKWDHWYVTCDDDESDMGLCCCCLFFSSIH